MANVEDRDLEDILVRTEAPKRVESKKDANKKVAKLTGRTIASLRAKIKENNLEKAFKKYNKKYRQMQMAAETAYEVRKAKEEGADVTDSELAVEYSIVASYDKKLAKLGAKLLKDEIKTAVAGIDVSNKVAIGKRIKVPRFLLTKMRGLVTAIEKIKTKQERKKLAKQMTKQTKEYIKSSLDGAVFKENGTLQEEIDSKVIRDLGLKGGKNDTESRLDSLRGFVSMDGKTPLFANNNEEDELEKENKSNTDLPPIAPEATVEKEPEKVNVDDLLKNLNKGVPTEEPKKVEDVKPLEEPQPTLPVKEVKEDEQSKKVIEEKPVEEQKEPQVKTDDRLTEVDEVLQCNKRINRINEALETTKDPEVREMLLKALENEKENMNRIVNGVDNKQSEKQNEEDKTMEPIVISEEKKPQENVMENVKLTEPETKRVEMVSKPSALRVTVQDIKNLEERNKKALDRLDQLKIEREALEKDKALLQEYIEKATLAREAEMQVKNMEASNAELKREVEGLSFQANEINAGLGQSKK